MTGYFKEEIDSHKLQQLFHSDSECLLFLSELKWKNGFNCKKCGNTNYCNGKAPFSRRCTRCKFLESATANTIFHNCKFPIHKAFYIAWHICKEKENFSSYEFARRLSLRQMTCWKFQDKIKKELSALGEKPEEWRSVFFQ